MQITTDQARALYRAQDQGATIDRGPDLEPVTKTDIVALINSYVDAGGKVDGHGEPTEWETITDQLNMNSR